MGSWKGYPPGAGQLNGDSPNGGFAVTPNDSTDLTDWCLSLWIGGAGTLKITYWNGDVAEFENVPVGRFDAKVRRVWATVSAGVCVTKVVAHGTK